jgi:hypothetical protein
MYIPKTGNDKGAFSIDNLSGSEVNNGSVWQDRFDSVSGDQKGAVGGNPT